MLWLDEEYQADLNSNMDRIQLYVRFNSIIIYNHLNSNMDRIQLITGEGMCTLTVKFKFQYG